ncbi:MAG: hypothetical protein ACFFCS_12020, partial [Candidatus Hodarchaeota archaeon]
LTDNALGLALLGNYPGTLATPNLMDRYIEYMKVDTLGWMTNLFLSGAQNLELIGSTISYGSAYGYIPIMMEYQFIDYPEVFFPFLFGLMRLVIPILLVGLVSGWVANTKKNAMLNALASMIIIGVIGIILNIAHVYMNWESVFWKFNATIQLNPIYVQVLLLTFTDPTPLYYIIGTSIVAFVFSIINGAIMAIVAALAALKK